MTAVNNSRFAGLAPLESDEPADSVPAQHTESHDDGKQDSFRWAKDIETHPVEWVWSPYLPRGHVTVLDGDPGAGKSFITCAIAASLSLGMTPGAPAPTRNPTRTLICTAEDDASTTVIPRLQSMNANLSLIAVRDEVVVLDAGGLALLDRILNEVKPDYVALDTLTAFMGPGVDMHRANETRSLFAPLRELADRHGCAIQPLRHLNKSDGGKAIYRGLGSIDIVAACRSVMLAGVDPDDPDQRVLLHTKSNLAMSGDSLGYKIDQNGQFTWTGISGLTAERVLGVGSSDDERSAGTQADELLHDVCRTEAKAADVIAQAELEGISRRTIQRRAAHLCTKRRQGFGRGSTMWWRLRTDDRGAS
jgi:RecA-family ATPase